MINQKLLGDNLPLQVSKNLIPEKYIKEISFSIMSPEMIRKLSSVRVIVPDTYDEDGYPIEGGLADLRMGVIDPGLRCRTCGGTIKTCPGHFGSIELVRPVIHPEYAPMLFILLRSTCNSCRKILLPEEDLQEIRKLNVEEAMEVVSEKTKKINKCPHCGAVQEVIKFEKPTTFYIGERQMMPNEVRDELAKISDDDARLFGFVNTRPEYCVLTVLLVPPVTVRPSITLETGERSEDDLTHKLVDIIRVNERLEANINAGAPQLIIEDLWELLQYHITTYFNNESVNIPPARHRSGRPLKTLSQRLKGKEGRFRYNLTGKRVNFSARTVVSADSRLKINEVGIPKIVAEELTVPIRVTDWNIQYCREFLRRKEYPTVVYVTTPDGKRKRVTDVNREEIANSITSGWIIERQIKDGDIVLFNRHPSLHRMSIMAHRVRVLPGKTFRICPATTIPYNADFDGDEMNIHVPQTEEARSEAEFLLEVTNHIISPRHGNPIIAPTEDYITGIYILTKKDTKFTIGEVMDILSLCEMDIDRNKLPKKKEKGEEYVTGKDIFSLLLPEDINLNVKTKLCSCSKCTKETCPTEGHVEIKNGKLLYGAVEKKVLYELISIICQKYGNERAAKFINDVNLVASYTISRKGFTISLDDYKISEALENKIREIDERARKEANLLITRFKNKTLERDPGKSLKETLEGRLMSIFSNVRSEIEKLIETELTAKTPSIFLAKIGARGSMLNVEQISGVISQQSVRGKRLRRGFTKRITSHFEKGDIGPCARGYITSNFYKGLDPVEYFFQACGGRDSLVNTAIGTGRSGYLQRRLIYALQDLVTADDLKVVDQSGNVIQFLYGGDGIDPMKSKKIAEETAVQERE